MGSSERLFSIGMEISFRKMRRQRLHYKFDVNLPFQFWQKYFFDHVKNFFPYDDNLLAEPWSDSIKNSVFPNGFTVTTGTGYLLIPAVPAAYTSSQYPQCWFAQHLHFF